MSPVFKLRDWSTDLTGSVYTAPEQRELCLVGCRVIPYHVKAEGIKVKTSAVVAKVGPKTYRTRSGSVYVLDGAPDSDFVQYCTEIGKPLDLDDPIKFRSGIRGAA